MTAEKANKVYMITEEQMEAYRTEGYDIRDDPGRIVAYGAGKSVPYEEYAKVCAENKGLKEALEEYCKIEAEAVQEQAAEAPAKTAGKKKASE